MTKSIAGLFILLAPLVNAQSADGTYHFTTAPTPQSLQEAATVIRTVADIPQVSVDTAQTTVTFHGDADKVALAQWFLPQLDTMTGDTAQHVYPMAKGEVTRVNFLSNVQSPQGMQEMLTVLRTVADVQKIFNFTQCKAIVLRGKEGDIAFAEWILDQLNVPAEQKADAAPREFTVNTSLPRSGTSARINRLANVRGPLGMQQLLTVLRTVGDIQKIFVYTAQTAFVLRGSDNDIARAEWLIQNLDQPADQPHPGTHTYTAPSGDDVTRIFYMRNATGQSLNAAMSAVRAELKLNSAFYMDAPAALVVRGTADQVEAAAQLIAARNGLAIRLTEPRAVKN